VIRGGNSDLLSAATVEAMRAHHAGLDVVEVPDEGHAPLLTGDQIIGRIASFVKFCERSNRRVSITDYDDRTVPLPDAGVGSVAHDA
jgi:hypothetical protein